MSVAIIMEAVGSTFVNMQNLTYLGSRFSPQNQSDSGSVPPRLGCRAVTAQLYGANSETVRHRTLKLDRVSNVLSFVATVRHKSTHYVYYPFDTHNVPLQNFLEPRTVGRLTPG